MNRTGAKTERNKEIVRLRVEEKLTLQAIGDLHGITKERVRQIVNRELGIKSKKREFKRTITKEIRRGNTWLVPTWERDYYQV